MKVITERSISKGIYAVGFDPPLSPGELTVFKAAAQKFSRTEILSTLEDANGNTPVCHVQSELLHNLIKTVFDPFNDGLVRYVH